MATIKPGKKRKGRLSSAVIFLIAFVLFLVVFGGLCLWAVMKINSTRQNEGSSSLSVSTEATVAYTAEDAQNLFLVTTDKEAKGFMVVHSDPANARMRVLAIPRDTAVDVGTSQKRLFEVYAGQGVREAQNAVGKLLGIEFGNYAVISYDNAEKWISRLNDGLAFTLAEPLDYTGEDGAYSVKLEGGHRTLTAAQVIKVMRYPKWHGGRKQEADVQAQLLTAMLNQYLLPSRDLQKDFDGFIGMLQSDIKVSHFVSAKPALEHLASRNTGAVSSAVSLDGAYVGNGEEIRFEASSDASSRLRTILGNTP